MGWDPQSQQLRELTPEFLEQHPEANLWQHFREGDVVLVKREADLARPFRAKFRIAELSENRIILTAVGAEKAERAEAIKELEARIEALKR
jgi:hypothetical protein